MGIPYTKGFVQKIVSLYQDGRTQIDIALELNVSKHVVKRVIGKNLSKEDRSTITKNRKIYSNSFFIGKEFGNLKIIGYRSQKNVGACFECECKCGKTVVLPKYWVLTGNTKSCGCLAEERRTAFEDISGHYWSHLQKSAIERNIVFDIDIQEAWQIFLKQDKKCPFTGVELTFAKNYNKDYRLQTASLDRIDNSKDYTKDNIQWVHKRINVFRGGMTTEQLYSLSKRMYLHRKKLDLDRASNNRWDMKYLSLAEFISQWSKDESTKVGAVIFDENFKPISFGYNGLPQKICDKKEWLSNRDIKYKTIVHAETNAILFANRSLDKCSIATWPLMPCSNCASVLAQAGISRVVSVKNDNPRWQESFELSKQIFQSSKIELVLYENTLSDLLWL